MPVMVISKGSSCLYLNPHASFHLIFSVTPTNSGRVAEWEASSWPRSTHHMQISIWRSVYDESEYLEIAGRFTSHSCPMIFVFV